MSLTYAKATEMTSRVKRRKLAHNTYLRREGDTFAITFHETDIIILYPDGSVVLNTGGWLTMWTKERLTRFSPARIFSDKGMWLVYSDDDPLTAPKVQKCRTCHGVGCYRCECTGQRDYGSKRNPYRYFDGIRVDSEGDVITDGKTLTRQYDVTSADKKTASMQAGIKAYAELYTDGRIAELYSAVAENGSMDDCLFCRMSIPGDSDHLISHIDEGYTMFSLMYNAVAAKGYRDPSLIISYLPMRDRVRLVIREYLSNALITDRAGRYGRKPA